MALLAPYLRKRRPSSRAAAPSHAGQRARQSFSRAEIGRRDGWLCGICRDGARPIDPGPAGPRALSASLDHVVPLSAGGTHTRDNVRIANLWCNVAWNTEQAPPAGYMRAALAQVMDGTPMPEQLYRDRHLLCRWPGTPRSEYLIALQIAVGRLAPTSATESRARDWRMQPAASLAIQTTSCATGST